MKIDSLLEGAVDLHIHSGPDCMPRWGDCIDIARLAVEYGMKAIVFKDHFIPSYVKARLAEKAVPGIACFGVQCLNHANGGINVRAVSMAIDGGAKIIMMPTQDAEYAMTKRKRGVLFQRFQYGQTIEGIGIYNPGTQEIREDLCKILELIAKHNLILSNGHIAPEETIALGKKARELGVKQYVVEHPNGDANYQVEHLKTLTGMGAFLNISYNACSPVYGNRPPKEAVEMIKAVGPEHCTLISDGGQIDSPAPAEGLRVWCNMLMKLGIARSAIDTMIKDNPMKVLGIN